ncbi:hypothetical protein CEY16_00330 [Halalkalibacillus sediminis]|uniref:RsgI N-terminal anti-sigma domain-containing protein n=1 Tax=Halalkalibacillus sediminis TaxID=2018042 RepID=A0A2I0QVU7_9BACI|nr:anti-sigma factor domain-containing protein [Halalkalibacillus sediminis]PKR78240.1 hypothetical protein CEY16_00330 [Halalkalibacillus sediminis]
MRRGVIVEQKKRYAVVMTSEGSFYKTKLTEPHVIGQEITFQPIEERSFSLGSILEWFKFKPQWKAATALLLCILLIIPLYPWMDDDEVHAYVNIDINPSMKIEVNNDYEVISIDGLNEDGDEVIDSLNSWENKSLQDVSSEILMTSKNMGFLTEDHNVLLGISFADRLKSDDSILNSVSQSLQDENSSLNIASFEVPSDIREEADVDNTSMNLLYASKLMESRDENLFDENKNTENTTDNSNSNEDSANNESSDEVPQEKENRTNETHEERTFRIIEQYLKRTNKDELPPGLKKKFEEINQEEPPDDLGEVEDEYNDDGNQNKDQGNKNNENKNKGNKDNSNSNKGNSSKSEKAKDKSNNKNHPSNNKDNSEKKSKTNSTNNKHKADDHPSQKNITDDHPSNRNEKSDDHPSNRGNGNDNGKSNRDSEEQGFTPPGQKKKQDRE